MTPEDRQWRASVAAHAAHGKHGSKHMTRGWRAAAFQRFLNQVDPTLPEAERLACAEQLQRSHLKSISRKGVEARRRKAGAA